MHYHYQNPTLLFHGKRVDLLSVDAPHPKGGIVEREVVAHPGAVVVLPMLDSETIVLIRNDRYVVQRVLWELPAGTLDEGEEPLACARRELEEETGFRAQHIAFLMDFFTTPGFCNEKLMAYLATGLEFVGQRLDDTETINVFPMQLEQAMRMIQTGEICDAKTICALLFLKTFYTHSNS